MPDRIQLSVIIVTWNSEREISGCVNSLAESLNDLLYEIIVIDNASSDSTKDELLRLSSTYSSLNLILNNENLGFTKACNQGIAISKGEYVLLLNPDTTVLNSSVNRLIGKLTADTGLGAAAPQLLNDDGSIQYSCRTFPGYFEMFCELSLLSMLFPKSQTFSKWKMKYFDHNTEREVDQPMAAALLVNSNVLKEVQNLDERYTMFFNDVDLCKKIYLAGYKIKFCPDAKIAHSKGRSVYKDRERMIRIWNNDCLSYFRKFHYNFFLYYWLMISLKISGVLRILIHKIIK